MTELITASTRTYSGIARVIDKYMATGWGIATTLNSVLSLLKNESNINDNVLKATYSLNKPVDNRVRIVTLNSFDLIDVIVRTKRGQLFPSDVTTGASTPNDFRLIDVTCDLVYYNSLPYHDIGSSISYHAVHQLNEKPHQKDFKYVATTDFSIGSDLASFTGDFTDPVDYSKLVTPLSPVGTSGSTHWKRPDVIDIDKSLTYGYSVNNFLIGGSTDTDYSTDEDATEPPEPPIEPPEKGEVIRIVNVINVVVLPSRTPIEFTNFTLSIDLSSIAWVATFDIADAASLALIKPQGGVVKEVEIDINGELFNVFIGRTSTSAAADKDKGLIKRIKCTGWSNTKLLSHPYSPKRSYAETSSSTPSGILTSELTGTGFIASWESPSWLIPADVFGYIDKAPLAGISELVNSVGGVIIPHQTDNSFTVKPYYPISPWNWGVATPDVFMTENQFFTMDTEWIPQESPDSIYVYGEEKGVGVKCVKQGTAGLVTLPTVTDKHITDTIAGTERGRIEVAKNGFKEIIPVTTYIDANGIIMPQKLMEVTDTLGGTWRGMVIGTSISVKRNGNAVIQALQIERHYD